ncbi:hypothetical protein ACOI1H_17550, partial [Loktanella sp. DJP18]|uniref:hypothetical protein n=1 Tax=Loktanella sp. DJP18 TaxID=3409788 RepID=UPI003BB4E574
MIYRVGPHQVADQFCDGILETRLHHASSIPAKDISALLANILHAESIDDADASLRGHRQKRCQTNPAMTL